MMKKLFGIGLPAAFLYAVPWILYVHERHGRHEPAHSPGIREQRSKEAGASAPAPADREVSRPDNQDSAGTRRAVLEANQVLAKDPLDLFGLALRAAANEADRIERFEKELSRLESLLGLAEQLRAGKRWEELASLLEKAKKELPRIELAILDPEPLERRCKQLRARMYAYLSEAHLALLNALPSASPEEQEARECERIKLANQAREFKRQIQEFDSLPVPTPGPRRELISEVGSGRDPLERDVVSEKIRSMKISCDFSASALADVVGFIKEMSGLNIVIRSSESRACPVSLTLRDSQLEAVLDHVAASSGLRWELDRFGIITLLPLK
jgi:hypothetical protein